MPIKNNIGTHFLLLCVAIIWGSSWTAGRVLSNGIDSDTPANLGPATAAWLRYAIVVIMFYFWYLCKSMVGDNVRFLPPDQYTWRSMIVLGALAVMIYQLFFMHGMKWTAAGDASLIIPINPVFTVLLAYPMLGQKISKRILFGLLFSIIGVIIIIGWSPNTEIPFDERMLGDLMIIVAALSFAASSIITKITIQEKNEINITATEIVIWYSFIGWLLLSPWMFYEIIGNPLPQPSKTEILMILYLGSFSTVLAYVWFAMGIERIGPTSASSYIFLVPVFGVLTGWALLEENISMSMIIGFTMIVIGVREVQKEDERMNSHSN